MRGVSETWKNLRNSFFAGLLVVVPVAASFLILIGLFTWVTDFMLPASLREQMFTPLYRLLALALFVAVTTGIGYVTRLVVGRRALSVTEKLIARVPVLNKTYGFLKEVSHTMLAGQKTIFERVVLVEYPRPGVYAVGFVTSESEGEVQAKTKTRVISVFVPTTPNPTSGFLLMVPRDQVRDLEMSVAEGMKLVISGGAVVPPYTPPSQEPAAQ